MANSLRGQGKNPPVTRFDRTHVRHVRRGVVTVIPLDQIDHIGSGKQRGQSAFLIIAVVGALAAAAGGLLGIGIVRIVALAGGGVITAAAAAAYILQRPRMIRIQSARGEIKQIYDAKALGDARDFVEGLLEARTQFLEGVYEEVLGEAYGAAGGEQTGGGPAPAPQDIGDGP